MGEKVTQTTRNPGEDNSIPGKRETDLEDKRKSLTLTAKLTGQQRECMIKKAAGMQETRSTMSRHAQTKVWRFNSQFTADPIVSPDYFRLCSCLTFTDETKMVSSTGPIEVCIPVFKISHTSNEKAAAILAS